MINIDDIQGVNFCHYTTMDNAKKILSSQRILLGKLEQMNDRDETENNNANSNHVFATCFCHSEAKNIPMFYLYSGIDGKGCRIEFTPATIREMLDKITVYPINKKNKCLKKPLDKSDYEVSFDWIHYVAGDGFSYYRGGKGHYFTSKEEATALRSTAYGFVKNPIWRYEKEFRIIVSVNNDFKYDKIAISIPKGKLKKGISIMCGPEIGTESIGFIRKEFEKSGIRNVSLFADDKIKISMKLIDRSRKLLKR